ncbi:MAG: sigma-70 family RNA polymerase sigma factor [Silanimonas sp.]
MPPGLTRSRPSHPPDAEALEAALARHLAGIVRRDPDALGRFYDLTLGTVNALVHRILAHPQDTEEAVVDVYLQVWESAGRWDPARGPVLAWLRQLAWSRALDHYRRRHRDWQRRGLHPIDAEQAYPSAWTDEPDADPMARHFDATTAAAALRTLAPAQREVLSLVFGEGLSHADVSARTGWPLGTVKSHARRGMAALRRAMGWEGGEG